MGSALERGQACDACARRTRPGKAQGRLLQQCQNQDLPVEKMISSVLIANRGEIACRIIRTARAMGIRTVAVYSDADAKALHVRQADEAVHIGPSPARESYLVGEKIIAAAKATGAEALRPGYGFLSENEAFARRVEEEGLVFIGPKHASIAAMGDK